jgi:hypothetical protein
MATTGWVSLGAQKLSPIVHKTGCWHRRESGETTATAHQLMAFNGITAETLVQRSLELLV